MEDYIIFSCVLLGVPYFSGAVSKKAQIKGYWLCVIGLMILAALRGPAVGNDTHAYIDLFNELAYDPTIETRYEKGYIWLNVIGNKLWHNPQIIIMISSVFIFLCYGIFIAKYSKIPWLSLFIFFTYGYYAFAISAIRQSIALGFILISFHYIIKRKLLKFCLFVYIASLFHSTALVFLPAYFVFHFKLSWKIIWVVLLIGVGLLLSYKTVTTIVFQYFNEFEHYTSSIYAGETRAASVLYVIISTIIILISYLMFRKNPFPYIQERNIMSTMILLVSIACALYILSFELNIFDRIALYFNVFSIIILPNVINRMKKSNRRLAIVITVIIFFAYSAAIIIWRPLWNSSFPYSFYF